MKHSLAFKFKGKKPASKKDAEGSNSVYSAIASTPALDRYKEVLLPLGMEYENFMTNPVMLMLHDYSSVPVGKVLSISVTEEAVEFDFEFADSDNGNEVRKLFDTGFMNAFSVGLYPKSYIRIDESTPSQLEVEVANGKKQKIDLSTYKEAPEYIVNQWELLEISPVSVPANPEALIKREAQAIIRKSFDGKGAKDSGAAGQIFEQRLQAQVDGVLSALKSLEDSDVESNLAVVPLHEAEITDLEIKLTDNLAKIAGTCSSDGSGDKSKIDWGTFSKYFAWVDLKKADSFSGYRFLHHAHQEAKLMETPLALLNNAMYELLCAEDLSDEDANAVYKHLEKHYLDADLEAPEYRDDYSDDELAAIKAGTWNEEASDEELSSTTEGESNDSDNKTSEFILGALKLITDKIDEFEKSTSIKLGIQYDFIQSLTKSVTDLDSKMIRIPVGPPEEEQEDLLEGEEASKAFNDFIAKLETATS